MLVGIVEMKIFIGAPIVVLASLLLIGSPNAFAQNRNGSNSLRQDQQAGSGGGSQRQSGTSRQSGFGGQSRSGQEQQRSPGFSQSRNQGRQGANFGGRQQDNFVGSDAQQIRNQQNNRNRGMARRAMFDFAIESFNEMRQSRNQQHSGGNQRPPMHVKIQPLFAVPQPTANELASQVRSQLEKTLPKTITASHISVNNGTATIVGSVENAYDKQLAAKMLSLQPGISQVENRLTILSDQAEPLLLPAQ